MNEVIKRRRSVSGHSRPDEGELVLVGLANRVCLLRRVRAEVCVPLYSHVFDGDFWCLLE